MQRGAHAFPRLLHLQVGEPDQREARQAVGQVYLDIDRCSGQAIERAAVDDGQGHRHGDDRAFSVWVDP